MDIVEISEAMRRKGKTIYDFPLRVTYYARVSTLSEEQENSIENQIAYFDELIRRNNNWTFVRGYVDRVRGESTKNRANFNQMIDDAKIGLFDLVLTKEISRFARDTVDSITKTRELLRSNVGVYFINDNINTLDTDSELRLTIMSSIAADEVRKLSERVRFGHKQAIKNGNVLGNNRIFGYDKQDCKLTINEKEAEMVKLIFELYGTGDYSARAIEKELESRGYVGRNGTPIAHNTITGIIQNPKYKGYYCGNKVKITDYRTKKQRFLPEEEWVMFKDETGERVPAIVSEELWERCNNILSYRSSIVKSHRTSIKNNSVFTGKIWCGAHDKPFWRTNYSNSKSKGEQVYQWICSEKRKKGVKVCATTAVMENELYSVLSDYFIDVAGNIDEYVTEFLRIYDESERADDNARQIETLKARLEKENAKRDKLLELYVDGTITKSEFSDRNIKIGVEITNLEEDIAELQKRNVSEKEYRRELKEIENYFRTMYNPDEKMTKEQVDTMTEAIVERITVIPINKHNMKLDILLKTGNCGKIPYSSGLGRNFRRSGITFKKMIESYENKQ